MQSTTPDPAVSVSRVSHTDPGGTVPVTDLFRVIRAALDEMPYVGPLGLRESAFVDVTLLEEALKAARERVTSLEDAIGWDPTASPKLRAVLAAGVGAASQYIDTGRGDLDGWIDSAREVLDYPADGSGGCA